MSVCLQRSNEAMLSPTPAGGAGDQSLPSPCSWHWGQSRLKTRGPWARRWAWPACPVRGSRSPATMVETEQPREGRRALEVVSVCQAAEGSLSEPCVPVAGQPLHHLSCVVVGFAVRLCDSPWFLCLSHRQGAEKQHEVSEERHLQANATKLLGLTGTTRDAATSEQAETARGTTTGEKKK